MMMMMMREGLNNLYIDLTQLPAES